MPSRPKLREIVVALEKLYGKPAPFPSNDPWELILRENASYLVDDATREEVFRSLKARIGVSPEAILDAPQGPQALPGDRRAGRRQAAPRGRERRHARARLRFRPRGYRRMRAMRSISMGAPPGRPATNTVVRAGRPSPIRLA